MGMLRETSGSEELAFWSMPYIQNLYIIMYSKYYCNIACSSQLKTQKKESNTLECICITVDLHERR